MGSRSVFEKFFCETKPIFSSRSMFFALAKAARAGAGDKVSGTVQRALKVLGGFGLSPASASR